MTSSMASNTYNITESGEWLTSAFLAWCRPPAQLMAMSAVPWLSLVAPSTEPPALQQNQNVLS